MPKSYLKKLELQQNKRIQKTVGQKIRKDTGLIGETGAPARPGNEFKKLQAKVNKIKSNQDAMEKLISKHLTPLIKGTSLLKNPKGFIGGEFLNILKGAGPHAAAIITLITTIASSPEVVKQVIRKMAVKGAPLNRDFRVIVEEVITGFLSLDSQQRRDLGLDSFVVAQVSGFKPIDGTDVYNSLLDRDEIRINRVNQDEK